VGLHWKGYNDRNVGGECGVLGRSDRVIVMALIVNLLCFMVGRRQSWGCFCYDIGWDDSVSLQATVYARSWIEFPETIHISMSTWVYSSDIFTSVPHNNL
jgi:hypothetical protein